MPPNNRIKPNKISIRFALLSAGYFLLVPFLILLGVDIPIAFIHLMLLFVFGDVIVFIYLVILAYKKIYSAKNQTNWGDSNSPITDTVYGNVVEPNTTTNKKKRTQYFHSYLHWLRYFWNNC